MTWYPEFDSYDFKVEAPGVRWAIDVKDHHRYEELDPPDFGGLDLTGFERFVVVPDHRLRHAPGAVEIVAARCSSAGITACSASDLVKRLKEALHSNFPGSRIVIGQAPIYASIRGSFRRPG